MIFVHINKTAGMSIRKALNLKGERHKSVRSWIESVGFGQFEKRFSFSFVRNPYDRVASMYLYRLKTWQIKNIGFDEWVQRAIVEQQQPYYNNPLMFNTQYDWLNAYGCTVDFVGRFENLNKDFNRLCERIGIVADLPHVNATHSKRMNLYKNQATKETVREAYHVDFAHYGY